MYEYVFRFFIVFRMPEYIGEFFKKFVISDWSSISEDFENLLTNYRRYVYGIILVFTMEKIRLFFRYFYSIKRWDRFGLSYGIYENSKFLKVKKELLSTLGNVFSFGVSLIVFFVIIAFSIYQQLIKGISFEHNFMFEGIIFACFFWIAIVVYFALNLYQRIHNYYRNYLKNNVINQKKDAWQAIQSLLWHYFLNIFAFVIISMNFPIDLFLLFAFFKFIPWKLIFSYLREKRAEKKNNKFFYYTNSFLNF
ncbi:hypothetical protein PRV_00015 [Mycoplasma parvum str. Indiana]|uniref:Uncharacterized protein n=1 Tax=Mycoplasma parvum str. Indiana TaxID=1403316 RepID=U5NBU5_9MOLU|nr:hypothetical protein PRV_00015 [Mycoplasma parvum str. Indiana]